MNFNFILVPLLFFFSNLSFTQSLTYGWSDVPALTNGSSATETISIAIDSAGNTYEVGRITNSGTTDFNPSASTFNVSNSTAQIQIFIRKLDPNGNFLWMRTATSSVTASTIYVRNVVVDKDQNVILCGIFTRTVSFNPGGLVSVANDGQTDSFIYKLNANGNLIWLKTLRSTGSTGSGNVECLNLAIDSMNNVVASGGFTGTADFNPSDTVNFSLNSGTIGLSFLLRLTETGDFVNAVKIGTNATCGIQEMTISTADKLSAVFNYQNGSGIGNDVDPGAGVLTFPSSRKILLQFNPDFTLNWGQTIMTYNVNTTMHLTEDAAGDLYTAVSFKGTFDFDPGLPVNNFSSFNASTFGNCISKFTSSGTYLWTKQFVANDEVVLNDIVIDKSGKLLVYASYRDIIDINLGASNLNLVNNGGVMDFFLGKYTNSGELLEHYLYLNSSSGTYMNANRLLPTTNALYYAGKISGSWDADPLANTVILGGAYLGSSLIIKYTNCSSVSSLTVSQCGPYVLNGVTYNSSGVYTQTLVNASGCDSTITLNLTINNATTASVTQTVCDSYTWALNGTTYTNSGTYTHVGTNANGCPLTTTLNLTINNSTTATINETACDSYTWALNVTTYTSSGTYTHVGTNASGCTLTTTLNLTINNSTTATVTETACDSYTWALNGTTYTTSGTYTYVGTDANGCTLITTLNLTINNSTTASVTQTACDSYTWPLNGTTYTSSGTYTHVGTNAASCPLTTTLNLIINNSTTVSVTETACDSYTWALNGTTYTSSGTYTYVGTNAAGCVLTTTLNLTINNSTTVSVTETACDSYTWALNGTTYTSSGTYTHVGTNASGCTLTTTLNLTINNSSTSTVTETACDSYTWALNGTTYTSSGIYTHVGTNANGCPLTTTLNLTISNSTTASVNETACDSYTWGLNGTTYTNSGTYTHVGTIAAGCQLTTTLNLTINTVNVSTTLSGITITANASGASYQWIDCNNGNAIIPGETAQSFTPAANGNYAVIVTNATCSDTSACQAINSVGIDEFGTSIVEVYPNPTNGKVQIILGKAYQNTSVKLINGLGQAILYKTYASSNEIIFEIEGAPGVYFLEIETTDQVLGRIRVIKN
jgi:hypothetical protein